MRDLLKRAVSEPGADAAEGFGGPARAFAAAAAPVCGVLLGRPEQRIDGARGDERVEAEID